MRRVEYNIFHIKAYLGIVRGKGVNESGVGQLCIYLLTYATLPLAPPSPSLLILVCEQEVSEYRTDIQCTCTLSNESGCLKLLNLGVWGFGGSNIIDDQEHKTYL